MQPHMYDVMMVMMCLMMVLMLLLMLVLPLDAVMLAVINASKKVPGSAVQRRCNAEVFAMHQCRVNEYCSSNKSTPHAAATSCKLQPSCGQVVHHAEGIGWSSKCSLKVKNYIFKS